MAKKNRAQRRADGAIVSAVLLSLYSKSQNFIVNRKRRKLIPKTVRA